MSREYEMLEKAVESVRRITDFKPEAAIVLGSGLGDFADSCVEKVCEISYSDIKGFPVSTVAGHKGKFIFGTVGGKRTVVMQGRVHYYEGYTMQQVVMPIRLMRLLGAEKLLLTNAAGGICPDFSAGDLMLITGHISSFVPSPLIGENVDELGERFPDMTGVYDKELSEIIKSAAEGCNIDLKQGVYLQTTGPNYETPQEINMYRLLGADAVGMSTACEAMAARHAKMRVCGISLISNLAAGMGKGPLSHAEVQAAADAASKRFKTLVSSAVSEM